MATFYTGNTGSSTGPHLDFRVWDPRKGQYVNPNQFTGILRSGGKPFKFGVTSPYGMREHPTRGGQRMHHGIDYGTPEGTPIEIQNGKLLTTWDDKGGGGITSQYAFEFNGQPYEALLMHGSSSNPILSQGAVTDGSPVSGNIPTPEPPTAAPIDATPTDTGLRQEAIERTQNYANMSKTELNAAYDAMRGNPTLAAVEGMKMHKAFFGK